MCLTSFVLIGFNHSHCIYQISRLHSWWERSECTLAIRICAAIRIFSLVQLKAMNEALSPIMDLAKTLSMISSKDTIHRYFIKFLACKCLFRLSYRTLFNKVQHMAKYAHQLDLTLEQLEQMHPGCASQQKLSMHSISQQLSQMFHQLVKRYSNEIPYFTCFLFHLSLVT